VNDLLIAKEQVRYEQKAYWRNPMAAVFTFMFPVVFLVVVGTSAGSFRVPGTSLRYDQYTVVAMLTFGLIGNFTAKSNAGRAACWLIGAAGFIELIGGALLVLGLFTQPAAFILSGEMAVAYFMSHAPKDFFPLVNGGTLAIMYCFAFLYLATAGAGPWSVDAAMKKG